MGRCGRPVRWLFADQLGPHFIDDPEQPVLLVESRAVLAAVRGLQRSADRQAVAEQERRRGQDAP